MENPLVKFNGKVISVEKELIPNIFLVKIVDENKEYIVEMDMHKDVFTLHEGDTVSVSITREIPSYRDGIDYVARGTVMSTKKSEDKYSYLISIGGLLFVVHSSKELNLPPTEKVYVKIERK